MIAAIIFGVIFVLSVVFLILALTVAALNLSALIISAAIVAAVSLVITAVLGILIYRSNKISEQNNILDSGNNNELTDDKNFDFDIKCDNGDIKKYNSLGDPISNSNQK